MPLAPAAASRTKTRLGRPERLPHSGTPATGSVTVHAKAACHAGPLSLHSARGGGEHAVGRRSDHCSHSGSHCGADYDVGRVVDPGVDARVGDRASQQSQRHRHEREMTADGVGECEGRRGMTGRKGRGAGSGPARSGRRRSASGLMPKFTVAEVTPMETTPSSAARPPRRPPRRAMAAAMPSHRRERLAESERRRKGPSSFAVGVRATASYTARSSAPNSRNALFETSRVRSGLPLPSGTNGLYC
jgi:hypothetical protein